MIWPATSTSGPAPCTGRIATTLATVARIRLPMACESCAAGPGMSGEHMCVVRTVTGAIPGTGTTTWGYVSPGASRDSGPLSSALCPLLPPLAAESVFFDWDFRSAGLDTPPAAATTRPDASVGRVGPGGELPESGLFTRDRSNPRLAARAVSRPERVVNVSAIGSRYGPGGFRWEEFAVIRWVMSGRPPYSKRNTGVSIRPGGFGESR